MNRNKWKLSGDTCVSRQEKKNNKTTALTVVERDKSVSNVQSSSSDDEGSVNRREYNPVVNGVSFGFNRIRACMKQRRKSDNERGASTIE
eukprot:gene6791-4872_t